MLCIVYKWYDEGDIQVCSHNSYISLSLQVKISSSDVFYYVVTVQWSQWWTEMRMHVLYKIYSFVPVKHLIRKITDHISYTKHFELASLHGNYIRFSSSIFCVSRLASFFVLVSLICHFIIVCVFHTVYCPYVCRHKYFVRLWQWSFCNV